MDLSVHDWIKVAGILVLIANMGLSAYLFMKARSTKAIDDLTRSHSLLVGKLEGTEARTRQEIQLLVQRDGDMDKRLSVLETRVAHMPTHNDLAAIQMQLRDMSSDVATVIERSETTLEMVRSIQQHLVESPR